MLDELEAKAMAKAGLAAGEGVSHGLKVESATEAWLGNVGGREAAGSSRMAGRAGEGSTRAPSRRLCKRWRR